MASRAGIALSRLAYDAQFTITRVDGYPDPAVFRPPTTHTLSEAHTIKDMIDTFERVIDFDLTHDENGYTIAYPIASNSDQRGGFYKANLYSHDHFHAWANGTGYGEFSDGEGKRDVCLLFMDLTPGQVAANVGYGNLNSRGWTYNSMSAKSIILSEEEQRDVYDKLIKPIVPSWPELHHIGILRPEEAFPDISATDLESMFPEARVRWVTLDDIAHGAAVDLYRSPSSQSASHSPPDWGLFIAPLPISVILANGHLVMVIPEKEKLPMKATAIFTTSRDNQTTATIRMYVSITPVGEVTLEGLIPKLKGQTRIKVTLRIDSIEDTRMTVEELGTGLKQAKDFGDLFLWYLEDTGYSVDMESMSEPTAMTFGEDGVIGELPE
ncbi:hypothetical protein CPB86DRAFT_717745 [Serendipita vermifera]|nr:hypothetical protein CPB86DRAFT_717745 [Serendipita vermifera]